MSTKNNQGKWWGTAPHDWALYLETTFIPLYKKIISRSDLSPGVNVLDIGCGSGLFINMAGAKGATTSGIDLSPELLAIARQRNPLAALFNHDMEQLPFEEKSFDLVTGFNSLQYADDIASVLTEIKRVMKDAGRLVIGIWGSAAECEALKVLASIASLLPEPPGGSPGPLALSAEKKVENLIAGAGMKIVEKGVAECHWNFSSLDEALRGILSAGPSAEAIRYAGLEPVKKKLVSTLESFKIYEEIYVLENVFHYFIAGKA
ncbi:MAG: class I SAM-dependent methyltransferase [Chitinophagaceae bacterium]|nr:class I SAM-dependent methyltransferase [Chitinophagaceae bacterium]MBL0274347.1 class I SAM-dependent methyltransferase [Chitinophagaceae bacterium]